MTQSKRKPKFAVGQVVCIREGWMNAGYFGRICSIQGGKDSPLYELQGGMYLMATEVALRPLTRREATGRKR